MVFSPSNIETSELKGTIMKIMKVAKIFAI